MKEYSNEIDIRRWIREIKRYRWLYVISLIFFIGISVFYYLRSMPLYTADAVLLIEDPTDKATPMSGAGASSIVRMFSIGGFGSSSVDNELAIIKSNELREKVIKELGLNFSYIQRDGLGKKMLYNDSPVKVEASATQLDALKRGFLIKLKLKDGKVSATAVRGRIFKEKLGEIKDSTLPCVLKTDAGDFSIVATSHYSSEISEKIDIIVAGTPAVSEELGDNIKANIDNLKADAITLVIKEANPEKGVAILNAVMQAYNEKRLERRRKVAQEEVDYYTSRLDAMMDDLTESEGRIERFKSDNKLSGIESETGLLVDKAMSGKEEVARLNAQLNYYGQVLETLRNNNDSDRLIPVVEGFGNPMIGEYNTGVIERRQLSLSATPENIQLKALDETLGALKKSIIQNAEGVINEARNQLATIKSSTNLAVSRLDKMPHYEREYRNLFRDQSLKNELYVFLLQKRESAELKLLSNTTLGFVVDEAYVETKPKNTKALIVCVVALALAFILPTIFILLLMQWRNSLYDQNDLSSPVLKRRSYMCEDPDMDMGEAVWRMTDGMKRHVIYVATYGEEQNAIPARVANSLKEMGYKTRLLQSNNQQNYSLLTSGFVKDIDDITSDGGFAVISVPNASNISILNERLKEQDATLVLAVRSNFMTRKQFNRIISGLHSEHLYVLLIK